MATPIRGGVTLTPARVRDLKPAPYNPREIGDREKEGLRQSLAEFGLVEPIIVNRRTNHVVGGHQRLKILLEEGVEETDVIYVDLTPAREKALNLSLNNPRTQGRYTAGVREILAEITREAPDLGARLQLPELERDLQKVLDRQAEKPGDPAGSPGKGKPRAKPGDLWALGRHRVLCGDATKAEDVDALMGGQTTDLVFTDPPYGVSYVAPSGKHAVIEGDRKRRDALFEMVASALKHAVRVAAPWAPFYVWHARSTREDFAAALKAAGLEERQYLVWVKPAPVLGHGDYLWAHEPCFYACRAGSSPRWYGGRDQPTVWRLARGEAKGTAATTLGPGLILTDGKGGEILLLPKVPKGKRIRALRVEPGTSVQITPDDGKADAWDVSRDTHAAEHPNQKPVALAVRALSNSTKLGDRVLDLFGGSGSTLLAAEATGRTAHLMELEPRYVDLIVARWEEATGLKATLEAPTPSVPRGTRGGRNGARKAP